MFEQPEHRVDIRHVLLICDHHCQDVIKVADDMLQPLQDTVYIWHSGSYGWGEGDSKRQVSLYSGTTTNESNILMRCFVQRQIELRKPGATSKALDRARGTSQHP